jgi:flagellar M-ring protein FliF
VLLSAPTLDSSAVKGIAQLVSSSVPGLSLDKVTITDSTGQLLWPTSSLGGGGTATSKQAAETQYDSEMAAQVDSVLAQTLGPGKAQVQINADLNANQATSDSLVYATKGVPLTQQKQTEALTGTGGTTGGVAGAIPTVAATGASGNSNYKNTNTNTTFGVNKTVTHEVVAPGAVNRQTVSVLIDKSVPASALPAIKTAVAGAVGLNAKRGDSLAVSQLAFAKPAAATPAAAGSAKMIGYAKYAVIGLGALLFLFFMTRMLKRREKETFGQPTWLRELETPRRLAALEGPGGEDPTEVRQLRTPAAALPKRQVEQLVEREPDRVAQQVRAWMSED